MEKNRKEWVIHVWGKARESYELNEVEKFHIDMLKMFKDRQNAFDRILVNIAMDDINDTKLFNLLKKEIKKAFIIKNVEFKMCQNDMRFGEFVTFKPYVFDRIGEDVDVFYTHFKGYCSYFTLKRESFPMRVANFNEMFWSYMMYSYSLDLEDVDKNLKDHCAYYWSVLKCSGNESSMSYYKLYLGKLKEIKPNLAKYISTDSLKYSPGSFAWYNLKNIGEVFKDKPEVMDVNTVEFVDIGEDKCNLATHFSEIYMIQFLDDKDCYSVNDYNEVVKKLDTPMYISAYASKKFGKELLKDFEKYLIDKKLL